MSVILGNNTALNVQGSGTICATINTGGASTSIVLCNVLFVPGLTKNLVLTSHLINLGCTIQLNHAGATIQHPQQVFPPLATKCINNMLVLNLLPAMSQLATQALAARTSSPLPLTTYTFASATLVWTSSNQQCLQWPTSPSTQVLNSPPAPLASMPNSTRSQLAEVLLHDLMY
jgi:hypothetical protein